MARVGSFHNSLYDQAVGEPAPEVGMGATVISWTDRDAYTITEVSASGHRLTLQADTARRTDSNGMSDAQSYEFERNEDGHVREATRRKDGSYRLKGGTQRVLVGVRMKYHDFSF